MNSEARLCCTSSNVWKSHDRFYILIKEQKACLQKKIMNVLINGNILTLLGWGTGTQFLHTCLKIFFFWGVHYAAESCTQKKNKKHNQLQIKMISPSFIRALFTYCCGHFQRCVPRLSTCIILNVGYVNLEKKK